MNMKRKMKIPTTLRSLILLTLVSSQAHAAPGFFSRQNDPSGIRSLLVVAAAGASIFFFGKSYYHSPSRLRNKYQVSFETCPREAATIINSYSFYGPDDRTRIKSVFLKASESVTADIALLEGQEENPEAVEVKKQLEKLRNLFDDTRLRLCELDLKLFVNEKEKNYGSVFNALQISNDESKKLNEFKKAVLALNPAAEYPYATLEPEVTVAVENFQPLISNLTTGLPKSKDQSLLESAKQTLKKLTTFREYLLITPELRQEKRELALQKRIDVAALFSAIAAIISILSVSGFGWRDRLQLERMNDRLYRVEQTVNTINNNNPYRYR